MADFKDLTGWREELENYYEEGGQEAVDSIWYHSSEADYKKPRVSQVQEYAELLLNDPELRDAVAQQVEWYKVIDANGGAVGRGDPEWDNRPKEAHHLMAEFRQWYSLKTGYPLLDAQLFNFGMFAACDVVRGKYESVYSKECIEYLLESRFVDPDEGSL